MDQSMPRSFAVPSRPSSYDSSKNEVNSILHTIMHTNNPKPSTLNSASNRGRSFSSCTHGSRPLPLAEVPPVVVQCPLSCHLCRRSAAGPPRAPFALERWFRSNVSSTVPFRPSTAAPRPLPECCLGDGATLTSPPVRRSHSYPGTGQTYPTQWQELIEVGAQFQLDSRV